MARERFDAVVVGSGPNGLAAAITMAERGRSVLLLEARDRLGGALATEELTLPGFLHDTFSAVHPAAVASPVFARWPLADHGLEWVHPELPFAHPLPDGRAAVLARDLGATVAALDGLTPGDGRRWQSFVTPYLQRFDALRHTMLGAFPPVRGAGRLAVGLRLGGALEFLRLVLLSAEGLAGELFEGDAAAAWLYGASLHGDVPPQGAGSAVSGVYLMVLGHAVGWPSPRGGAGRLAGALAGHLTELGAATRTGAAVERVIVRHGRVQAVELAGDMVETDTVLCDVTPHGLLALAGEALPAEYARRMAHWRYAPGTFKVDWALAEAIPWTAPEVRRAGTVHVGGIREEIAAASVELARGRSAARPFVILGQQSIADPTRTPDGRHTAWGYTHVPAGIDWAAERDRWVERVEAQVERFAPGFRNLILDRHVLTPVDLERRNRNLVRGDLGAGSYALDQLVFRPVPTLSPYRTPVRGVYLASAATFPGGAVHGVCGHGAARRALADERLRPWRR